MTHAGTALGTLPVVTPLAPGMTIIFSGRRWRVAAVVDREKLIEVEPSAAGRPPPFGGGGGDLHDAVAEAMRDLYSSDAVPGFLDATARELLAEGRMAFRRHGLDRTGIVGLDGDVWLFPWVGTVKLGTLALALRTRGLDASPRGIAVEIPGVSVKEVAAALRAVATAAPPDPLDLAVASAVRSVGKYDVHLTETLLLHSYASQRIDAAGMLRITKGLLDPGAAEGERESSP